MCYGKFDLEISYDFENCIPEIKIKTKRFIYKKNINVSFYKPVIFVNKFKGECFCSELQYFTVLPKLC